MDTAALIILTIAVTIEFMVGMALNTCILLIHVRNLRNGLSLGPSDKVHLTKALLNIPMLLLMTTQCMMYDFWPQLFFMNNVFLSIMLIIMFLIFYNYWLTAVLCVYYCTNITTSGHHIIVWLKRSLSSYPLHILLVSGLGSCAISVPAFWYCEIQRLGNVTYQSIGLHGTFFQNATYKTIATILGCFLPFTIAFVSTAFTLWSLLNHMWRMKQNNPGFTRSKFQTQINATRTMVLFLLISFFYSITQMFFTATLSSASDAVIIITWFIILSYPISEAIIIIQSSSKLRNALLQKFFERKEGNSEAET